MRGSERRRIVLVAETYVCFRDSEEIAEIASLGVEMKNNYRIGVDASFEEFKSKYDAVVLAIGAWESMPVGCPGEELEGVFGGVDFLREVNLGKEPKIGKKCAVIGGGRVAARKVHSLLASEARVTVIAPELVPVLAR